MRERGETRRRNRSVDVHAWTMQGTKRKWAKEIERERETGKKKARGRKIKCLKEASAVGEPCVILKARSALLGIQERDADSLSLSPAGLAGLQKTQKAGGRKRGAHKEKKANSLLKARRRLNRHVQSSLCAFGVG